MDIELVGVWLLALSSGAGLAIATTQAVTGRFPLWHDATTLTMPPREVRMIGLVWSAVFVLAAIYALVGGISLAHGSGLFGPIGIGPLPISFLGGLLFQTWALERHKNRTSPSNRSN